MWVRKGKLHSVYKEETKIVEQTWSSYCIFSCKRETKGIVSQLRIIIFLFSIFYLFLIYHFDYFLIIYSNYLQWFNDLI